MAKINKNIQQKKEPRALHPGAAVTNKKHIIRIAREKRQKGILILVASILGAVVLGLVVFGLIKGLVVEPQQAVAEVNGTTLTIDQFRKAATFRRISNNNTFVNDARIASYYKELGFSAPDSLWNEIYSIQYEMSTPLYLGEKVVNAMVDDELIKQEAEKAGITVSDTEVSDSLPGAFGYYPNGTPTSEPTATSFITPTFSSTQIALLATSTLAGPTSTKAPTATASPTGAATATLSAGTLQATNTPEPTATEYTLELYQSNFSAYTEYLGRFNLTQNDLFDNQKQILLRDKVYQHVTEAVPAEGEQVWTQHILVATQEEADAVLQRLDAGENWKDLALELSLDSDTNYFSGDQGWYPRGIMGSEIENAAFSMTSIGEMTVVQDSNGFHVIRLMGREQSKPILDTYQTLLKDAAFSAWLEDLRANSEITLFDTWKEKIPENPPLSNIDLTSLQ